MENNADINLEIFEKQLSAIVIVEPTSSYGEFRLTPPRKIFRPVPSWAYAVSGMLVFALATISIINSKSDLESPNRQAATTSQSTRNDNLRQIDPAATTVDLPSSYVLGNHYLRVDNAVPIDEFNNYDVIEFFWYPCIPCFTFENDFVTWTSNVVDHVTVTRIPAIWSAPMRLQARAYYTAEQLGILDIAHSRLYQVAQQGKDILNSEEIIGTIFERLGVDKDQFRQVFHSDEVNTKVTRAESMLRNFQVRATPTLIVEGKYLVTPTTAGSFQEMLNVADYLLGKDDEYQ